MRRFITNLVLISVLSTMPLSVARSQTPAANPTETLIKNATVLTITKGTIENADVLIRAGKIAGVGKNLQCICERASDRWDRQIRDARHHRLPLPFNAGHD